MDNGKIFTLSPICKSLIWGGKKLSESYNKICSDLTYGEGIIGESWELVSYGNDVSEISDGINAGRFINDVVSEDIPIILKYIDAAEPLSVQVHPNKTEMWVVIDADPGSEIVYGLKDSFDGEKFRDALKNKRVFDLLNTLKVKPGDVFFIPSGLVHSLGRGILVAEIQQASTETYRVYDYDRVHNGKPRELHIDAAMGVIRDYSNEELNSLRFSLDDTETFDPANETAVANCKYFSVYRYDGTGANDEVYDAKGRHAVAMCYSGIGKVCNKPIRKGETIFVSKDTKTITLEGNMNALLCFFPFEL